MTLKQNHVPATKAALNLFEDLEERIFLPTTSQPKVGKNIYCLGFLGVIVEKGNGPCVLGAATIGVTVLPTEDLLSIFFS